MPQYQSMALPPRLPLVVLTENRDDTFTKDSGLCNCFLERSVQNEITIIKRGGYTLASAPAHMGDTGHGVYYWNTDNYAIFGDTLYRNGVAVATGLNTASGIYRFETILGAMPKLVLGNGAKTYAYTVSGGLTSDLKTLDTDFPTTTVKGPVYQNGTLFVMDTSAVIWNSAVNSITDATSWNALNFISAQMESDAGVALSSQLVYVVAFNEWSTEFFYYAGNPSGSPLSSVQGSKITFGCKNADSVQSIDDRLFWLSFSKNSKPQVSMLDQLTHTVISTAPIDKILDTCTSNSVYSLALKCSGHSFYVLTFPQDNLTIVYDVTEQLWHRWTDSMGNYFPFVAATYDSSNRLILQHESDGCLYYFGAQYYSDAEHEMLVDIITPGFDANTSNVKMLSSMTIVGDQVSGSVLLSRYSDNDYQSWSNFREIDLGSREPGLNKCGSFRRRAYHFRHRSNTPLRIKAVDVRYDVGVL